jgi:uncharacterized protein YdeI (YjbR/CyaY-like superfamily)
MNNLPADLTTALQSAGLAGFFAGCTNAHQDEYLKWIGEAKRPETRKNRIAKAVEMVAAKRAEEKARPARKR